MELYAAQGFEEFIICLGYKGYVIKEYFQNYLLHQSDVTFDFQNKNQMIVHRSDLPRWKVTLVETGQDTQTGGRLARVAPYVGDERFMLTYGDGVANVDLRKLVALHGAHGKLVTITAVRPPGRFGALVFAKDQQQAVHFEEKPMGDGGWINGGSVRAGTGNFCVSQIRRNRTRAGTAAASSPPTVNRAPVAIRDSRGQWTPCGTNAI